MTTDQVSPTPKLAPTDRWRAMFTLACALSNRAVDIPASHDTPEKRDDRRKLAAEAETHLLDLLRELITTRATSAPSTIERKLADAMIDPAVLVLASLWAFRKQEPPARMNFISTSSGDLGTPEDPALAAGTPHGPDTQLSAYLNELVQAPHMELVRWVGADYAISSPSAAYATCCYYAINAARSKDDRDLALRLLTFAAVDPTLANFAPHDPWLAALHDTSVWKSLFPKTRSALGPAS